jgi:APA family basic amino acid/polyamine antiporter
LAGPFGSKKTIDALLADSELPQFRLKKEMGRVALILIGVGGAIGAGIYFVAGLAAAGESYPVRDALHQTVLDALSRVFRGGPLVHTSAPAGPAVIISFAVVGVLCLAIGVCYAELASILPLAGSVYTYSYAALGELAAWMTGWILMLEYGLANVVVGTAFSGALRARLADLGITLPDRWSLPIWSGGKWTGSYINAPAFLIIVVITLILARGVRAFSWTNMVMVALKSGAVVLFVVVGSSLVRPANWRPFAPAGMSGILAAGIALFYTYVGFDCVSIAAEEAKHPERDVPAGILGSVAVCAILYMSTAAVLLGITPYTAFRADSAGASALLNVLGHSRAPGTALAAVFAGILIGLVSSLFVFQYGQIRLWYAMSRDGFLPKVFSVLHPQTRVPLWCTWVGGAGVALCAGLIDPGESADLAGLGALATFALVPICLMCLRKSQPDRPRAFRAPWMPWLAVVTLVPTLIMMASLTFATWIRFLIWLLIGLSIYAVYGRHHDKPFRRAQPSV